MPTVGTGEVLLKMAGVGLCHTDLHFLEAAAGAYPYEVPFTLGHENGGWVEELAADVDDLAIGDAVVVAGIHSCGRCGYCLRGHDNYCPQGWRGRGYGQDGGLATYLVVPRRELVPLTTLDPRVAGPLSDAGATSYHAIRKVLGKLVPGSTALVIGAGGLGGYAIQFLRRLTGARVIAVDVAENRLDVARDLGAHETLLSDEGTAQAVRALTGGEGAHVVLDFVGTDATMPMALAAAHDGRGGIRGGGRRYRPGGVGSRAARVRRLRADGRHHLRSVRRGGVGGDRRHPYRRRALPARACGRGLRSLPTWRTAR